MSALLGVALLVVARACLLAIGAIATVGMIAGLLHLFTWARPSWDVEDTIELATFSVVAAGCWCAYFGGFSGV